MSDNGNQHRWKVTGHEIARAVTIAAKTAKDSSTNEKYIAALEAAAALLSKADWPASRWVSPRWTITISPKRRVKGNEDDD